MDGAPMSEPDDPADDAEYVQAMLPHRAPEVAYRVVPVSVFAKVLDVIDALWARAYSITSSTGSEACKLRRAGLCPRTVEALA